MQFHRDPQEKPFYKIPPDPLYVFKRIPPSDPINLPEVPANRKLTDFPFFYFFMLGLLFWGGLSTYVACASNADRALRGEDSCGNICGKNNVEVKTAACQPEDYTKYPVALYSFRKGKLVSSTCIKKEDCAPRSLRQLRFGRCFPVKGSTGMVKYIVFDILLKGAPTVSGICSFSIGASIMALIVFRYHTRVTMVVCFFLGLVEVVLSTARLWYVFIAVDRWKLWVAYGGVITIFLLLFISVSYKLARRFKLVVCIYEEATKAIFKQPGIVALPFLSIFIMFAILGTTYYLVMLEQCDNRELTDNEASFRMFYYAVMGFMFFWVYSFVNGCQSMVVAGCIATYFFTRNKDELQRPIRTSMKTTLRYHLGTVAAGALVVTIFGILHLIASTTHESARSKKNMVMFILFFAVMLIYRFTEEVAEYLTKKAYIVTAMHGTSFYRSGKRAARLLWYFVLDALVMDGLVYTVVNALMMAVFTSAMIVSMGIVWATRMGYYKLYFLIVGAILAFTINFFFIAVINVAAETIFLCFCEDRLMNDGSSSRPYFMPRSFSEYLMACAEEAQKEIDMEGEGKGEDETAL